jgi:hypothetical protein
METAATLQYLCEQGFLVDQGGPVEAGGTRIGVNLLCSLTAKKRDAHETVVQIRSTSSLTSSEYIRFAVICSEEVYDAAKKLELSAGKTVTVSDLAPNSDSDAKERKSAGNGKGRADSEVSLFLRVLLHGNVLYIDEEQPGPGADYSMRNGVRVFKKQRA